MEQTHPVSVVIPTLGSADIETTIRRINQGSLVPVEILLCIPATEAYRVAMFASANVRVVTTPCRGQVAQRAFGFMQVTQPLVLQMDDDILLLPDTVEQLAKVLARLGPGNAVAPIYRNPTTGRCLHASHGGALAQLQNLYAVVVSAAPWGRKRMGVVTAAGVAYGVDERHCFSDPVETQWQPGGCVLSYRTDLVTEDYFPFVGKAYCEDVIHSILRRRRGMRLWIVPRTYCETVASPMPVDWRSIRAEMTVRRYVVHLVGGKPWRLAIWVVFDIAKRVLSRAFHFLRPRPADDPSVAS